MNPFDARVQASPLFGAADEIAVGAFAALPPEPEERLLAAVAVEKGTFAKGYVMLTTHGIRFVQLNGRKRGAQWTHGTPVRVTRSGTMIFLLVGTTSLAGAREVEGHLHDFADLCQLVTEAAAWQHGIVP